MTRAMQTCLQTANLPRSGAAVRAVLLCAVFVACAASAGTVTWDGGGTGGNMGTSYNWGVGYETAWVGDTNPGASDEAVFPVAFARPKVWLTSPATIDQLTLSNTNAFNLTTSTSSDLSANGVSFLSVDGQPSTNTLSLSVILRGDSEWFVGEKKSFNVLNQVKYGPNPSSLKKTGAGTLDFNSWVSNTSMYTGTTFVAEGTLRLWVYNTILKSTNVIVGDGLHPALLESQWTSLSIPDSATLTVNTNGTYRAMNGGGYIETCVVNDGTIDIRGANTLTIANKSTTPWNPTLTMTGGVITNGTVGLFNLVGSGYQMFATKASDKTALVASSLACSGNRPGFHIEDGAAPVDFELSGPLRGNMTFFKTGPGTMALSSPTGGDAYRVSYPVVVSNGTFLVDNGRGAGSNGVSVAAGALLGGTGHIYGLDAGGLYGLQGNVSLEGASGNPATLAPGTVDRTTGAWLCGTLTVGNAIQTNNVTLGNYSTLRSKLGTSGTSSRLAVIGNLFLNSASATDKLDIIASTGNTPVGEHILATFSETLKGRFDSVTLNGAPLPSNLKLEYRTAGNAVVTGTADYANGRIVLVVPAAQTVILIR